MLCYIVLSIAQKYHYDDKRHWDEARDKCLEDNSDLLVINDHLENHWIYDFASENDIDVWLGLRENVSAFILIYEIDLTVTLLD